MDFLKIFVILTIPSFIYILFKIYKHDKTEEFSPSLFKETPIVDISHIKSKRFPYKIENTTNLHSSDTPVSCSGFRLGTNIGK